MCCPNFLALYRDFADGHICRPDLNIVIVTHGLTLRLVGREGGGEGRREGGGEGGREGGGKGRMREEKWHNYNSRLKS
jgi:hypothetical protein